LVLALGIATGPTDIICRVSRPSIIAREAVWGRTDFFIASVRFDIWELLKTIKCL
jgi:hypothetical protein